MRDFHMPGRSAVHAANGMVATSHPLAAQAGVEMLRAGGTAADAAVAAATVLHIAEPHMCGLGGDCFALVKPAGSEEVVALNGSGRAPAALTAERLRAEGHREVAPQSVHAVTVPGAVDGLCRLLEAHGRLERGAVLAPAIRYAEEGIPVAPRVAWDWNKEAATLRGAARDFYLQGGAAPQLGAVFRAPRQAEVLRLIAEHGRAGFYDGPVAEDLLASLKSLGGLHAAEDFAATTSDWGNPIGSDYRGIELLEHPPNGQGATAMLLLNILAQFDLEALDPFGADRIHLEAEATKLAYDARDRFIGDPGRSDRLAHMLAPETARRLAALIDPARVLPEPAAAAAAVHRDTVLVCAADRDGMAVTLIHSIFHPFGSGLASDRYGILLQNRGAGFCLAPGHPNELGGGRRPMHTIIPAMLREGGRVGLAFGVMGGQYQAVGHARMVTNLRDFGMELQQALDAPRAYAGPGSGGLALERGHVPEVVAELAARGHAAHICEAPHGGAQAIRIDHERGVLIGASDPRKDGCAIGW
jgi:gamma-glutamyltranspeptidase/glutathione hydrolase